ncbi:SphA family protein [Microvirga sesbaniae]|uniref:SphA family protein n=1 Tax=Microvirga sesbaniae TaxID=681392 RepID=UPI0021C72BFA|nr:transporter [Microvirga sp. HBU67692]
MREPSDGNIHASNARRGDVVTRWYGRILGAGLALAASQAGSAFADEGGKSFWLPGQYGSFAAVAPTPGWSLPLVFYGYQGSVGAGRVLPRGRLLSSGLDSSFDALFVTPTYTPDTMILGARASVSLSFAPGYDATSGTVAVGPRSVSRSDSVFGGSDLIPTAQLFWNAGHHNVMAYVTGNIPVGTYSPNSLASIGIGHAAIDVGGAYTYLNTKTGTEFSATLGLTRNFENPSTDYTNGLDLHLDLAASQFLNQQLFVGVVGYYYQQLTADQGQPAFLGPNKSRTRGIGPQIGYNFKVGDQQIYTNLRAYFEFDSYRRLQGTAVYATINIPLSGLLQGHPRRPQ